MSTKRTFTCAYSLPALVLAFAALQVSACTPAEDTRLSPLYMNASLDFVEDTLRSAHYGSIDGLTDEVATLLVSARQEAKSPMTEESFYFLMNSLLVPLRDAHTVVRWKEEVLSTRDAVNLPVRWNENGILVVSTTEELRAGDRVRTIGGLGEVELLDRLRRVIPAENDGYLAAMSGQKLRDGGFLRYLNLVDDDSAVSVEVTSTDGMVRTEQLIVGDRPNSTDESTWFGFEVFPEESLAVLSLDRFEYTDELVDAMDLFFAAIEADGIGKVAVDLRANPGGDSLVAFAFIERFEDLSYDSFAVDIRVSDELIAKSPQFSVEAMSEIFASLGMPALPSTTARYRVPGELVKQIMLSRLLAGEETAGTTVADRRLFVITDALSFSSSSLFATLVRDNRIGKIVGEPTGNRVNFLGSELRLDIPHTNMYLNMSTAKMIRPDMAAGDELTIVPDIYLAPSVGSIAQEHDLSIRYLKDLK